MCDKIVFEIKVKKVEDEKEDFVFKYFVVKMEFENLNEYC